MKTIFFLILIIAGCAHHPPRLVVGKKNFTYKGATAEGDRFEEPGGVQLLYLSKTFDDEAKARNVFLSRRVVVQSFFEKFDNPYYKTHNESDCAKKIDVEGKITKTTSYETFGQVFTVGKNEHLKECSTAEFWEKDILVLAQKNLRHYRFFAPNRADIADITLPENH